MHILHIFMLCINKYIPNSFINYLLLFLRYNMKIT